jgi:hypothetical protein
MVPEFVGTFKFLFLNLAVKRTGIIVTILHIIHRPVFYLKLNSTL